MIHLKTAAMLDYSELKSPSMGEVSQALEENFKLIFLQPSDKDYRQNKDSENFQTHSLQSLQKSNFTSESKLKKFIVKKYDTLWHKLVS